MQLVGTREWEPSVKSSTRRGTCAPIGESETVRRENRTVAVDEDGLDTQQLRNLACVLTTCTSEAGKTEGTGHESKQQAPIENRLTYAWTLRILALQ